MRPAPLYRYRIDYAKRGPARFLAHLDLQEAMERALRRARLPLACSEGFHPRPRMQFEDPLSLGWESERERLWVDLQASWPVREIALRLSTTAPPGIEVLRVFREAGRPSPPRARRYRVQGLERVTGADAELAAAFPPAGDGSGRPAVTLAWTDRDCVLTLAAAGRQQAPSLKRVLAVLGGEPLPAALRVLRLDWEPAPARKEGRS